MKKTIFYIASILILLFVSACTEPYEIKTVDYESVLVVEGTITNEMKYQEIKLSKTSTLENTEILTENGANVSVTANNGSVYNFSQDPETGSYISNQQFQAEPNVGYTLKIVTSDGKSYSSSSENLPAQVEMDKIYAERVVDGVAGKDGVQVLVDTEDPTGTAKYFRYEYEETYKIVAPYPSAYTFEISNFDDEFYTFDIEVFPREPEIICYSTENSTGINQTATTDLSQNRIFRFPVKYLSKDDSKMITRYSILVKQYVQSIEAYTFYKTISELGSVESLLSESQPGYVAGNISSDSDPNEKVIGFFEVSSFTSKRIYFNYEDFGLEKPPYFVDCDVLVLDYRDNTTFDNDPNEREVIFTYLSYFGYQIIDYGQPYLFTIAKAECSVCTSFSSNVKPEYWED